MPTVICPTCQKSGNVPVNFIGKNIFCPNCNDKFKAFEPSAVATEKKDLQTKPKCKSFKLLLLILLGVGVSFGAVAFVVREIYQRNTLDRLGIKNWKQADSVPGDGTNWEALSFRLPTTSDSAWRPDVVNDKIRDSERSIARSTNKDLKANSEAMLKIWRDERSRMAGAVAELPNKLIARMAIVASKLPDYDLEIIEKHIPDVFKIIEVDVTLFESELLERRAKEYADKFGADALKSKSARLASYLGFFQKRDKQ